MQFLTDENIPASLVKAIREKGYSVKDIKEESLVGAKDGAIMAISKEEKRVIITLDKDFATYPLPNHHGVVLLRYSNKKVHNLMQRFCPLLDSPLREKMEESLCEVFDEFVKIHKKQ